MKELLYEEETFKRIGFCMEIHRELGKGHDEVIYKDALVIELSRPRFRPRGKGIMRSPIKALSFHISILSQV